MRIHPSPNGLSGYLLLFDCMSNSNQKLIAERIFFFSSSFRDIPYDDWTCANVCDWLVSIGMGEHGHLFQENDIRGPNLLELSKDDLRELGVKKLGHRMTITNEVSRLTTNNGAATNL